jgi:hypothetical protein
VTNTATWSAPGGDGWYVSDGAANNVLHVDRAGKVRVVARFPSLAATGLGDRDGQGVPTGMTLGPDRTLYLALYGGEPFDGPPAAVVSLAPDAATRPTKVEPKLLAVVPHPIALALTSDGLAVVDYGGAPGGRGRGALRLIAGVGTDAAAGPRSTGCSPPGSTARPASPGCPTAAGSSPRVATPGSRSSPESSRVLGRRACRPALPAIEVPSRGAAARVVPGPTTSLLSGRDRPPPLGPPEACAGTSRATQNADPG